jgi:membrane-associated phospholipid phosphatase
MRVLRILFVFVVCTMAIGAQERFSLCNSCSRPRRMLCSPCPSLRTGFNFVGQALKDAFLLNANLISKESFIVIAATLPVYLGARLVDNPIQSHFFSHWSHKNINQMPGWCHEAVRFGVGIPIALLGAQVFLSSDPEWREAGWMLLLGIPFVIFGKDIIKRIDEDFCLRPWHEHYIHSHKRSGGGFPSGHMAQAAYIATLYGIRFGHRMAVPLTFFAAALGIVFLNCNRHYFSQIVAGAGLGALYGIAANKVIDSKLAENVTLGVCFDHGGPAIRASYRF